MKVWVFGPCLSGGGANLRRFSAPLIEEGKMPVDELIALGVTLFVMGTIGLLTFLGLTGFFTAW